MLLAGPSRWWAPIALPFSPGLGNLLLHCRALGRGFSATSIPPWTPGPRAEPPGGAAHQERTIPAVPAPPSPKSLSHPSPGTGKLPPPTAGIAGPGTPRAGACHPPRPPLPAPGCLGASPYRGSAHPEPLSYRCLSDPAKFHGRAMTPPVPARGAGAGAGHGAQTVPGASRALGG